MGQKGYKVLDLITNKVFVSKDITFYEQIFLFHLSSWHHYLKTPYLIPVTEHQNQSVPHHFSSSPISNQSSPPQSVDRDPNPLNSVPLETRPQRIRKQPDYLKDYLCMNKTTEILPSSMTLSSNHFVHSSQLPNSSFPSHMNNSSLNTVSQDLNKL